MKNQTFKRNGRLPILILLIGFVLAISTFSAVQMYGGGGETAVYIIQGQDTATVADTVQAVGGIVT
ncbi:MAG: hypothetical protein DWQ04_10340, partial [Chloroflexi bacterium]